MRAVISSIEGEYRRYRALGESAMRQVSEPQLAARLNEASSSIATLAWHVAGNLASRFTDFLTSDGEKPWRDRESEFAARAVTHVELLAQWEAGWSALFGALAELADRDLARTVAIRAVPLTVCEALHRSLAHTSYHVGQIVFVAKALCGASWQPLSIPPGQSRAYNAHPTLEKPPEAQP